MLLPLTVCLYTLPVIITMTLLSKLHAVHVPVPLSFRSLIGGPVSRDFNQGLGAFQLSLYHTYCLLCFLHPLETSLSKLHIRKAASAITILAAPIAFAAAAIAVATATVVTINIGILPISLFLLFC